MGLFDRFRRKGAVERKTPLGESLDLEADTEPGETRHDEAIGQSPGRKKGLPEGTLMHNQILEPIFGSVSFAGMNLGHIRRRVEEMEPVATPQAKYLFDPRKILDTLDKIDQEIRQEGKASKSIIETLPIGFNLRADVKRLLNEYIYDDRQTAPKPVAPQARMSPREPAKDVGHLRGKVEIWRKSR
ncbi:MAG TPA: hypothetical protein VJB62_02505 [Patescibacteria group bacterium]|nr:hypothetical protein [Patescibacteria group bacterium]